MPPTCSQCHERPANVIHLGICMFCHFANGEPLTTDEARARLERIRLNAEREKTERAAVRASFKARRDVGLARRHAARLRLLTERSRSEPSPAPLTKPSTTPHTESGTV